MSRGNRRDHTIGLGQRRAGRQRHGHVEAALRQLRNEVEAERRHQRERAGQRQRSRAKHAPRMGQRARQQAVVGPRRAIVGTDDEPTEQRQATPRDPAQRHQQRCDEDAERPPRGQQHKRRQAQRQGRDEPAAARGAAAVERPTPQCAQPRSRLAQSFARCRSGLAAQQSRGGEQHPHENAEQAAERDQHAHEHEIDRRRRHAQRQAQREQGHACGTAPTAQRPHQQRAGAAPGGAPQRTATGGLVRPRQWRAALERSEHRDQAHRHQQRHQHRERDRQGLVAEQLTRHALHEHERKEHRHRGQRRRSDRHADLTRALHRRRHHAEATLAQPRDVLQHHDRIVDHHAGGQREPAQRHDVERQVQLVHEEEGRDQRHRQRQRDDERAPAVTEEQQDDEDRQRTADQRVLFDVVQRRLDEGRLVLDRGEAGAGRQTRGKPIEFGAHRLGHADGVGVAFLVDGQLDRLAAIDAHDAFALLVALAHLGNVLETDRHAGVDADHEVADLVERTELVDRAHEEALAALVDAAARGVDVLVLQPRVDLVDVDAQARQLLLVDQHLDLVLEAAANLDRRHASHRRQVLLQILVGIAPQLLELHLAGRGAGAHGQAQPQDRIGRRIEAQQQRLVRFQRQLHAVELVAHFEAGHVHVGAPGELEHDIGLPRARDRMHPAHVLDHADRFLDRLADEVLDLGRRRTFVIGTHRERGIGQVGQQVDLEARQTNHAEQHQSHGQHADRDAAPGGEFGQVHRADPASACRANAPTAAVPASSTCTWVPSRTALRPTVITRSPALMPSRTSMRSPSA